MPLWSPRSSSPRAASADLCPQLGGKCEGKGPGRSAPIRLMRLMAEQENDTTAGTPRYNHSDVDAEEFPLVRRSPQWVERPKPLHSWRFSNPTRAPRCPKTGHTKTGGYATARFGPQRGADGPKQNRCTAPDGTSHYYVVVPASSDGPKAPVGPGKRHHLRKHDVACPRRAHIKRNVRFKGTRTTAGGAPGGSSSACHPMEWGSRTTSRFSDP
jgi:hypothetical protein